MEQTSPRHLVVSLFLTRGIVVDLVAVSARGSLCISLRTVRLSTLSCAYCRSDIFYEGSSRLLPILNIIYLRSCRNSLYILGKTLCLSLLQIISVGLWFFPKQRFLFILEALDLKLGLYSVFCVLHEAQAQIYIFPCEYPVFGAICLDDYFFWP